MARIKSATDIEALREGGIRLGRVLVALKKATKAGISTQELNTLADRMIREGGDTPAFLNYRPEGAPRPFPAALCLSINDEIVHGIPNENPVELVEGDIVGFDLGLVHEGLVVDSAITVPVGNADAEALRLIAATEEGLTAGIKAARGGARIGDISAAIQEVATKYGYGAPWELGGHGVGHKVHEEPFVPNLGKRGTGPELEPGMVLALEPMFNEGSGDVLVEDDGYTIKTADGSRSAHFEHTILITEGEAEILTKRV